MNIKKMLYMMLGCVGLALGAVGAAVPLIPAFPFLLLAAFCFAKSSERLHNWFIQTKLYKDNLQSFVEKKGMTRATKIRIMIVVTVTMGVGFIMMSDVPMGRIVLAIVWVCHILYFVFGIKNINDMEFVRKISINELLYVDMQEMANNINIQFLYEINGDITVADIKKITEKVQINNKDINVYLSGNTYYRKESNHILVDEIVIEDENLLNSTFFTEKINPQKESVQIWKVVHNNKIYIVFKLLHSVFDGKGALLFIDNFFATINNGVLKEFKNSITDYDFVKQTKYNQLEKEVALKYSITESAKLNTYIPAWKKIEIEKYHKCIVARLAVVLAREFNEEQVKFMIPVDIRRHNLDNNYSGNLTLPVFLDVDKKDTYKKVNSDLLMKLKNHDELNIKNTKYFKYDHIPKIIRKSALKVAFKFVKNKDKFVAGGIISHIGKLDLNKYSGKVNVEGFLSLPIQQPLAPFAFVIAEYAGKTVMGLSYYKEQFSEQYIEQLINKIKQEFDVGVTTIDGVNNIVPIKYSETYIDKLIRNINTLGDKTALVDQFVSSPEQSSENRLISYNDLRVKINNYISFYKQKEMIRGDRALLYLSRGSEYVSAFIAAIICGIVVIPVDKACGEWELENIIKDSEPKIVLEDDMQTNDKHIFACDNTEVIKKDVYNENDSCYIIYSSGTMGQPKKIVISHKNINNYLMWADEYYKTKSQCCMPFFTSLSVDLTMTSVFLPLLKGGIIKVFRDKFSTAILKRILADKEINVVKATPTHLSFIMNKDYEMQNKDAFIIGGEILKSELVTRIKILSTNSKIYNEYGPAETTVGVTCCECSNGDLDIIPIGVPIYNTNIVLLDDNKIINEDNTIGEILISGYSVFDITDENVDKFIEISGVVFYKSGDLGYTYEGNLYCVGRKDSQVKVNGNRVDLEKISNELNKLQQISDSVILCINEQLVAFVQASDTITKQEILEYVKTKVIKGVKITEIIFVDHFNVSKSGKIDTDELKNMFAHEKTMTVSNHKQEITSAVNLIMQSVCGLDNYDSEKTLYDLNVSSFEIIALLDEIADSFVPSNKQDAFIGELISDLDTLSIAEIVKVLEKYKC